MTDTNKSITIEDSDKTAVVGLREAVLAISPLLTTVFDRVDWDAGILLCPYTKVPEDGDTSHVISGMELVKNSDTTQKLIVKETIEDANPNTKIYSALENIMVQETAQKIEKSMLGSILADTTIDPVAGASADWTGISSCITHMGTHVFNTVGSFYAAVSLDDYLVLIQDTDYKRAKENLGNKVIVVVSTSLSAGEMVIMHEHGVAGSVMVKEMEIDSAPSKDAATLVLPYRTGLKYDVDFVRVVKP
tara:strand:+ start:259 stop:999 length:741 start_codon:yes stop_codon:yes gene_type:complete